MTDAQYELQKKRIKRLRDKWVDALWLNDWKIEIVFAREGIRQSDEELKAEWQPNFETQCRWEYMQAHIRVSVPHVALLDDKDLERDFVHELIHCLLNEARNFSAEDGSEHEERVVSQVTNILVGLARK